MRNTSDSSDSAETKSIIGTPASNLLTINGTISYLGAPESHEAHLDAPRDPSATPARPTASPLLSVPATPKTKQLPPPPPHSGPPSASTGTSTALPSPSSKAMPPPKLVVTNLKRKNPGQTTVSLDEEAGRPSKKTAPSPKPRRKNVEKARDEALT